MIKHDKKTNTVKNNTKVNTLKEKHKFEYDKRANIFFLNLKSQKLYNSTKKKIFKHYKSKGCKIFFGFYYFSFFIIFHNC